MTFEELRAAFAALPPLDGPKPPDYTWARHCYELRQHVATSTDAHDFLRWSTVTATMVAGDVPYVRAEWEALRAAGWLTALDDPGLGDPPHLPYDPASSGNLIHQAYHLLAWTQATGQSLDGLNNILEIGGGYGALALAAWRRGFRGRYCLVDLPEFSLLQQFYLSNVLPPWALENFTWQDTRHPRYPRVHGDGRGDRAPDLLIACYSLSEVDNATRRHMLDRPFGSCLIAYQDRHDDMDNGAWFRTYSTTRPALRWQFVDKEFMPGHHYLIGVH